MNEYGKIPPQAIELEQSVLGGILTNQELLYQVMDIITPEIFYKDEHAEIYNAILTLFNNNRKIDILTVSNHLKTNGELEAIGGTYYLTQLTNSLNIANVKDHAYILKEKHIKRELINAGYTLTTKGYENDSDAFELLELAEKQVFDIHSGISLGNGHQVSELLPEVTKQLHEIKDRGFAGLATGFREVDLKLNGIEPSDLMIIAARPGMGKTSLALQLALNIGDVLIFSLEMSKEQLTKRLISQLSGIDNYTMRNGRLNELEWQKYNEACTVLENSNIFIDDTPALNIYDFRARCRKYAMKYKPQVIMADYLQLFKGDSKGTRENEITQISAGMKATAKDLDLPVIALSQLSRAVETRGGNKRPILSDLRESGSIEQDADQVLFIYRPEYYGEMETEEGESAEGIAEIIVAKNRHGALGPATIGFHKETTRFHELSTREEAPY